MEVQLTRWRNQFNLAHSIMLITSTRGQIDTRIFSSLPVAGLCVTIGRYWYLFKRLTALPAGRFYRFEHIVTDSSFKAHSKQGGVSNSCCASMCLNCFTTEYRMKTWIKWTGTRVDF